MRNLKNKKNILNEQLTDNEVRNIRELIRMEVASILFDLFKKRKAWL
tara:strand:+ start:339 stop:479 length:141 start_codon:yes stop_codon:yes gene_type:complete